MASAPGVSSPATPDPGTAGRAGIQARLSAGTRLSAGDAASLLAGDDLSWLGGLAHAARLAAAGDRVAFRGVDIPADGRPGEDTLVFRYGRDEPAAVATALLALRDAVDAPPVRQVVLVRADAEPPVAPAESMRLSAVARLVLPGVAEVACDLASHPVASAELMLHFGTSALLVPAGDLDADAIADLILDAGFRPVLVDPAGAELRDFGAPVPQARRRAHPQSVFT